MTVAGASPNATKGSDLLGLGDLRDDELRARLGIGANDKIPQFVTARVEDPYAALAMEPPIVIIERGDSL